MKKLMFAIHIKYRFFHSIAELLTVTIGKEREDLECDMLQLHSLTGSLQKINDRRRGTIKGGWVVKLVIMICDVLCLFCVPTGNIPTGTGTLVLMYYYYRTTS
jgi:hypothetical protein